MKRLAFLVAGIVICLLAFPPIAAAQGIEVSTADDDDDAPDGAYAFVFAEPQMRGDLRLLVYVTSFDKPPDVPALLRSSLGCDWRPVRESPRVAQGTCRALLAGRHGAVRDTLRLAPLAEALREAGAVEVRFNLAATGEPDSLGKQRWIGGSVGATAESGKMTEVRNWKFRSLEDGEYPPPFRVEFGSEWTPARLIVPLISVLIAPALLAISLRMRMKRLGMPAGSGAVWLNWVLLASWLYWISVVGLSDLIGFASFLNTDQWLIVLVLGTMLFCGPPLVAIGACLLALSPRPSEEGVWRAVGFGVLNQATLMVPLGIFLMGTALVPQNLRYGLFSLIAAYAAFRAIAWGVWRYTFGSMVELSSGDLRTRASELARAAGVELKSLALLENRSMMEANAFASPGGRIAFTRGLAEHLTTRELDAVIGHEVGHLRGKHSGGKLTLLLGYLFIVSPALSHFISRAGLPSWIMILPISPMLYVLAAAWLSQRHELAADARAVTLTNDPEACIGALSRLARLTQSPVDWGGIQGSILSHPSMRRRVLAIARRFQVDENRALAILQNPDTLVEGERAVYSLPRERRQHVYTPERRISHAYWGNWTFGGTLIGLLVLSYYIYTAAGLPDRWRLLVFPATLAVITMLTVMVDEWRENRFFRRMRRKMDISPAAFVALIPGEDVEPLEGVYAWDLGSLTLDRDRLSYRGERAAFSLHRSEVQSIELRRGPWGWIRTNAVVVRSASSTFSLRLAEKGRSRRLARILQSRLEAWRNGESPGAMSSESEPLPGPDLHFTPVWPSRLATAWYLAKTAALLFGGALLVTGTILGYSRNIAVPSAAAMIYLVVTTPVLLPRT